MGEHVTHFGPKQALSAKRGQDVHNFDWFPNCPGLSAVDARLNTKTVNLQTMLTEETDTSKPLKRSFFDGDVTINHPA